MESEKTDLYLDSGAFVKLYIVEKGSEEVQDAVCGHRYLTINYLQEAELRNAIWAAAGSEIITSDGARNAIGNLEDDFREGRLVSGDHDWELAWRRAIELSARFTRKILCRTLDILHIALAEQQEATLVVTGDHRQAQLCHQLGINVVFIGEAKP